MIERLTEADRPRWTELWAGYLEFYATALPPEQYDHTWFRLMNGVMHGFGFRHRGHLEGITHFLFHESGWTTTPVCYLQDLYIDPSLRGTGGGRQLIEAVGDAARQMGASRMYWLTQDHNQTARQLYDRLARHSGFIRYEYPL